MMNFRTMEISRFMSVTESGVTNLHLTARNKSITGFLETATAEFAAMVEGEYGKTFRFFSDDLNCDIRIGDRVTEKDSLYDVKGVNLTNDGPGRKLEIVLVKPISQ